MLQIAKLANGSVSEFLKKVNTYKVALVTARENVPRPTTAGGAGASDRSSGGGSGGSGGRGGPGGAPGGRGSGQQDSSRQQGGQSGRGSLQKPSGQKWRTLSDIRFQECV